MTGCVTSEKNHNLTHVEKLLLQCHFKLRHTGFFTDQWTGRQGCLENMGDNMGSNNVRITKCEACQYG